MRRLIFVLVPLAVVLGAGPSAFAAWTSTGSDDGAVAATSVNAGNTPATSRYNGTVPLSWAASTLASGEAVGYYDVIRSSGTTATVVCPDVEATSCIDTDPVPGPVSYAVVPRIGAHWEGASSAGADFTYDNVAPVTTVTTRTPAANEAGWNTGDVSVTLTSVDPGPVASGVKEIHYALDGVAQSVVEGSTVTFLVSQEEVTEITFYAVDVVGNVEGGSSTGAVQIDKTPPVSSGSLSGSTLTLSANDTGGSGVAKIEYKIGSAGTTYSTYGSPLTLTSGQTVYFHAVDVAGNLEAPDHQVSYTAAPTDTTAPVTTVSSSPPANGAGWNKSDVTLTLTATDAGSVTKLEWRTDPSAAYTTLTGPGPYTLPVISTEGTTTVEFMATDAAGNTELPKSYAVKIDRTAPGAPTITDPVEGRAYRSNNSGGDSLNWGKNCLNAGPNICGAASDGTSGSGVASVSFVLSIASGQGAGTCWTGTATSFTSGACGTSLVADGTTSWSKAIAYNVIAGRSLTLSVKVTDLAGNTSMATTRDFSAVP